MQIKKRPRRVGSGEALYGTGRGRGAASQAGDVQHRLGRWRGRLGRGTVERIDGKDKVPRREKKERE